jgi:hypothetical protein
METCCCIQKEGKLHCALANKDVEACCCTPESDETDKTDKTDETNNKTDNNKTDTTEHAHHNTKTQP